MNNKKKELGSLVETKTKQIYVEIESKQRPHISVNKNIQYKRLEYIIRKTTYIKRKVILADK